MRIIGLGHTSRVGKDTFANYLSTALKERDVVVKKIPFAWKLKDVTHQLYGWAGLQDAAFYETKLGERFRDVVLPDLGMTPVQVWVAFGTPAVREQVYDRTWVDYVLKTDHECEVLIIPDVRFPNEVEAIQKQVGTLIKVVRPGFGPRQTVADQALVGWTGWNNIIGSTGRLGELSPGPRPTQR
jgi:hypothetical protein